MSDVAGTPLKGIEECVHGDRWTDADELFQELRKVIRKGGQSIPDMAASAQVILTFITGFSKRRKIYVRQAKAVLDTLMEQDVWRTALAEVPAELREEVERLRSDEALAPKAATSSGGSKEQPSAQAADMAASRAAAAAAAAAAPTSADKATPGTGAASAAPAAMPPPTEEASGSVKQPATATDMAASRAAAAAAVAAAPESAKRTASASAATAATSTSAGSAPPVTAPPPARQTSGEPGGLDDDFKDTIAAIVKILATSSAKFERDDADELFSKLRRTCSRAKSTPGIFEREHAHATDVVLFLLQLAVSRPFKRSQVCEVFAWLREAPAWCRAMESSSEQVQQAAKDAVLPTDMLPWFGLLEEAEENPGTASEDLPLASELARRKSEREDSLGIGSEAAMPSVPRSSPMRMTGSGADQSSAESPASAPSNPFASFRSSAEAAPTVSAEAGKGAADAAGDTADAAVVSAGTDRAADTAAVATAADAGTCASTRTADDHESGEASAKPGDVALGGTTGSASAVSATKRVGTADAAADAGSTTSTAAASAAPSAAGTANTAGTTGAQGTAAAAAPRTGAAGAASASSAAGPAASTKGSDAASASPAASRAKASPADAALAAGTAGKIGTAGTVGATGAAGTADKAGSMGPSGGEKAGRAGTASAAGCTDAAAGATSTATGAPAAGTVGAASTKSEDKAAIAAAASKPASQKEAQGHARKEGASRDMPHDEACDFTVTSACELQPMDGNYEWVRKANTRVERQLRAEAASWTLLVSQKGGYLKEGSSAEKVPVRFRHVQAMKAGTQLVRCGDNIAMPSESEGTAWFRHEPGQIVPVATERAKLGKQVVAVNAANAYHAGGGFLTGGRHALEEAMCMQSTLFQSLLVAENVALAKGVTIPKCVRQSTHTGKSWQSHIPEDGVILSPHVEFFRGGSDQGYPFWSDAVALCAVVSVAMPNCNPRMRDCPVDAPADDHAYLAVLKDKFTAVCKACAISGARVLVLPDVGCGVFSNNPKDVGKAFGEVLRDHFPRTFDEIHIVGQKVFAEAAVSFSSNGDSSGSLFI